MMLQICWVCTLLKNKGSWTSLGFKSALGTVVPKTRTGTHYSQIGEICHTSSCSFPLGRKQTQKLDKDCTCPTKGSDETTGHLVIKDLSHCETMKGF